MLRYFLAIILLLPLLSIAQDGDYSLGASNSGMGNASVATVNHWSLFNNPGAIGSIQHTTVMVSYQNRYNLKGFHVIGGGVIFHHKWANLGLRYFKFGDELFSQQLVGITLSNQLQMISLGGGINLIQTHSEGYRDDRVWVGEFGGLAEITDQIVFGAHIFNFKHGINYPTTMKAGLRIEPLKNIGISCEVLKQLEQRALFKAGLEYGLLDFLVIRTGINLQGIQGQSKTSTRAAFGFGLTTTGFLMDYSFHSGELGLVHELSLSINFGSSE